MKSFVNRFREVQSQLVAQRYAWIRLGVTAGLLFVRSGVVTEFKKHHDHSKCSCMPDSEFWVLNAFEETVRRHSG